MTFTPEQKTELSAPLNSSHVKTREQGRSTLSYVESWHVIAEANRIFGFDAWDRETIYNNCVSERERKIGKPPYDKDGWGVTYVAKVRVTIGGVVREGTGAGHGIDADLGLAHESAAKESESDAMKRALMTFGNPFGLALYDKTQANVATETTPKPAAQPQQRQNENVDYVSLIRASKDIDELKARFEIAYKSTGDSAKKKEFKDSYDARKASILSQPSDYVAPEFDSLAPEAKELVDNLRTG